MADAVTKVKVPIGELVAIERLRATLPEAKRIASRQFHGPVWDALLAAEAVLVLLDEQRERFLRELAHDFLKPATAGQPEPPGEAGP